MKKKKKKKRPKEEINRNSQERVQTEKTWRKLWITEFKIKKEKF